MAYASIAGRARTSSKRPQAHAICDRCGARYNMVDLTWQYDWRGTAVQNLRILVCRPCYDRPQEQLRAIVLPADPQPIINARTQDWNVAESDYRTLTRPTVYDRVTGIPIPDHTLRVTEDCENRVTEPYGAPSGFNPNAVMPYNGGVQKTFGVPLELLSVTANGTATVTVTCSKVHGLQTFGQISVSGLIDNAADGFYSVNVLSATAFTYMTYGVIQANALLSPTTRIITALVGLPRGFVAIPQIYGPTLFPEVEAAICFLELEDGTGMFALEDGGGFITLEMCMQPSLVNYLELETSAGQFELENGTGMIQLEGGNQ